MKIESQMQSPINILTDKVKPYRVDYDASLQCHMQPNPRYVLEKETTLSIALEGDSILNHRRYSLVELHFHTPSEHRIDGKAYELEAHFVHKAETGQKAVVAVMLTAGKYNEGFEEVLRYLTRDHHYPMAHWQELLPTCGDYYYYLGSLTTAPYSEGVEWYLFKEPVEVSSEQIALYRHRYDNNDRPLQPLKNRVVVSYGD